MRCSICGRTCDWQCCSCGGGPECHYRVDLRGSCAFWQQRNYEKSRRQEKKERRTEKAREREAEERCKKEERKRQKERRREEERQAKEKTLKSLKYERDCEHQQIAQLQSEITQKQQEAEQHQRSCTRLTLSLAAKKNESEINLKHLKVEQEVLNQEKEACAKLNQEQQVIQNRIQELSVFLRTIEESSFLHRGEQLHTSHGHQHDEFLEGCIDHATGHALSYVAEHSVTAIAGTFLGTVAGAIASTLLPETLGNDLPVMYTDEDLQQLETKRIKQKSQRKQAEETGEKIRHDLEQLLEQQRAKEAELKNRKTTVSTLEEQCAILEKSVAQEEQQMRVIEQQKSIEQNKIRDLGNQKDHLQEKLKTEERQLAGLQGQVRSFGL